VTAGGRDRDRRRPGLLRRASLRPVLARDRIGPAIDRLDPQTIALLELSARKGLSDDEIAGVLRIEPAEVAGRRDQAVSRLADELGLGEEDRAELSEELPRLADSEWRLGAQEPARSGRRVWLVAGLVVLAVAVAAVVIAIGGKDDGAKRSSPKQRSAGAKANPPAPQPGRAQMMQRLNGTRGSGTAQLVRKRGRTELRLRASGFVRPSGGGYAGWLYNSRRDARRLYATTATSIDRDIPLPQDFSRYRFVEVARAIPGLNSPHSGVSLLRVPVSALR
jgi:hypothetical protein